MAFEYTPLVEGVALDAASINTRVTSVVDGLNAVKAEDIERYALRAEHLPSTVNTSAFPQGMTALGGTTDYSYNGLFIPVAGGNPVWTGLSTQGGDEYGPPGGPPGAGEVYGWRIPKSGARVAEILLNNFVFGSVSTTGILVRFSIEFTTWDFHTSDPEHTYGWSDEAAATVWAAIGLAAGGEATVILPSIRGFTVESHWRGSLDVMACITGDAVSDLTQGVVGEGVALGRVYGLVGYRDHSAPASVTAPTASEAPHFRRFNLDALPVRMAALETV